MRARDFARRELRAAFATQGRSKDHCQPLQLLPGLRGVAALKAFPQPLVDFGFGKGDAMCTDVNGLRESPIVDAPIDFSLGERIRSITCLSESSVVMVLPLVWSQGEG